MSKKSRTAIWDRIAPRTRGVRLENIEAFDARGMRRVYGRGDHFGKNRTFNMDVWFGRGGRLLARFWSRRGEVDWESYEVLGFSRAPVQDADLSEDWVPQRLREEYDNWIISNF